MSPRKKLFLSFMLIVLVIATGTIGYIVIEGWGVLDSLYMTVITITTIGFEEVNPLSTGGRVFTVILILLSVGAVFYTLNYAFRLLIEGELRDSFGRKRLQKAINRLRGHYIVCGYGRMGRIICDELRNQGAAFVVIEKEPPEDIAHPEMLLLKGDATEDETLRAAGIERASGLISVLQSDAENLYVVLSARGLEPSLTIVARAVGESSEQKLLRAGANRVVSPYLIGGIRIANMLLKPAVVDFIEFTTQSGNIDLRMEEVPVAEGSSMAGKSFDQCGIGRELGILIVAIKDQSGQMNINPDYSYTMNAGDILVAIGEATKLKELEALAGGK